MLTAVNDDDFQRDLSDPFSTSRFTGVPMDLTLHVLRRCVPPPVHLGFRKTPLIYDIPSEMQDAFLPVINDRVSSEAVR